MPITAVGWRNVDQDSQFVCGMQAIKYLNCKIDMKTSGCCKGSWHDMTSSSPAISWRFPSWASYQIRKIVGCARAGNVGNVYPATRFQRKSLFSDPDMHHGTCVTHVPWCMSGSLTHGGGEIVPGIPGACAVPNFTYLVRSPWNAISYYIKNDVKWFKPISNSTSSGSSPSCHAFDGGGGIIVHAIAVPSGEWKTMMALGF